MLAYSLLLNVNLPAVFLKSLIDLRLTYIIEMYEFLVNIWRRKILQIHHQNFLSSFNRAVEKENGMN